MNKLSLPLLALSAALTMSACTTEPTPSAPTAQGAASAGTDAAGTPAVKVDAKALLEVDDQKSAGPTVNVKAAVVTDGGFVVVASEGGRNILGYSLVPAGAGPTLVQVSLAEIITTPTELVARLYDDANGDGLYGAGDRPVSNGSDDKADKASSFPGESVTFMFTGADVINR